MKFKNITEGRKTLNEIATRMDPIEDISFAINPDTLPKVSALKRAKASAKLIAAIATVRAELKKVDVQLKRLDDEYYKADDALQTLLNAQYAKKHGGAKRPRGRKCGYAGR